MLNRIRTARLNNQESAFTLIELMVAVIITTILAGISVATFNGAQEAGMKASVKSDVRNTVTNIAAFVASNPEAPFVDAANITTSEGNSVVVSGSFRNYTVEGSNYDLEDWGLHFDATQGTFVERDYPVCTLDGEVAEPAPAAPEAPVVTEPVAEEPVVEETEAPTAPEPTEAPAPAPTPTPTPVPAPVLSAPTGLTATTANGNKTLSLAWNPVAGATVYTVSYDICIKGNKNCHDGAAETAANRYTLASSTFGNDAPITAYSVAVTSNAGAEGEASTVVKGNIKKK